MTQLTQGFNPMQYDPNATGGGGFPVGRHPVVIKSAEIKPTSAGDGGLVEFELEIIDGPARGASGAYRLNLYNKSEKAAKIAHSQLSALCHVTGQFQLGADGTQLSVLFNIPFVIEVTPQKSNPEYTEVNKVYDMAGNLPGKAPQNTAQAAAFQQPAQQQQAPQQAAQAAPAQGAQAWGQPPQGQPAQQAAPAATGWQQPAPAQEAAPAAAGWQQGAAAAAGPTWGAPR